MDHLYPIWAWAAFVAVIVVALALDLRLFQQESPAPGIWQSLRWSAVWFLLAMAVAGAIAWRGGSDDALQFLTGYLVEYSLSLDNIFAIALILAYFQVAPNQQHRVLFWGILGALLMRGLMIGVGVELLAQFHWFYYVMGAFLLWTGLRWGFSKGAMVEPGKNRVVLLARKFFPVAPDGPGFFGKVGGRRALTPLALALLTVEATDLIFATDSIPAIFAVTQTPFIIFSSNLCAVLGLRSLYFLLAEALRHFRYLKTGLALVLIFIGAKMLVSFRWPIPTSITLVVIVVLLGVSALLSVMTRPKP
jgi:tellurite resistance protein TerC